MVYERMVFRLGWMKSISSGQDSWSRPGLGPGLVLCATVTRNTIVIFHVYNIKTVFLRKHYLGLVLITWSPLCSRLHFALFGKSSVQLLPLVSRSTQMFALSALKLLFNCGFKSTELKWTIVHFQVLIVIFPLLLHTATEKEIVCFENLCKQWNVAINSPKDQWNSEHFVRMRMWWDWGCKLYPHKVTTARREWERLW